VPRHATLPATVSRNVIDLLRRDFDGLVITDAFDMGGLAAHFDAGEAAVRAIEAGEDQILFSADTDAAIAAVLRAVREGRITEARIDESVARILAAKQRYAVRPRPLEVLDAPEHRAIAAEIAEQSIALVRDERGLLPLAVRVAAVAVKEHEEDSLDDALHALGATHDADSADVVVLLIAARAKSGAGRIVVPEAAHRIAQQYGEKTVAVSFGSPYIAAALPEVRTYVNAWGIQPLLQKAAIRFLRTGGG
jgi:beta-N-acetylhexosaminidase